MSDVLPLRCDALPARGRALSSDFALSASFAVAVFLLHIVTAGRYGYHRDELYFVACARHLAWGYVDQPPVIALVAAAATSLFGQSLYALRLFSALAAALIVLMTGETTRRLGGGAIAQGFAMLAVALAPFYLVVGNLLTMNAFEPLFWTAIGYLILDILDEKQAPEAFPRPLPSSRLIRRFLLGAAIGLGILTKYTVGFFACSLCAALLISPQRDIMRRADFWIVPAVAALIVAPNIFWQYAHGWPQFVLLYNAMLNKDIALGPLTFGLQQILMVNPVGAPLWIAGLLFFLRKDEGRYRIFFWSYAALYVVYVALRAKVHYLAPIYPLLFAGGACATEAWFAQSRMRRTIYACCLLTVGASILPQVVPVLPLPTFLAYQQWVDLRRIKGYKHEIGRVPEQYADMFGWDRIVAQIASVYDALPPAQRARTAIWAGNYGQAAAIDLLGGKYGLPHAISGHNTYYLWGTHGYDGSSVIEIGVPHALLQKEFAAIRQKAVFVDPYVLPQDNNAPILLCTRPREPLAAFWPQAKTYW